MYELTWKYVKKIKNNLTIKEFENNYKINFTDDFKEIVAEYNGARPNKTLIMLDNKIERVLKTLLSFNKTDKENIFSINQSLRGQLPDYFIAFASDPSGNYFCFNFNNPKNINIVFWDHEKKSEIFIAKTFSDFLEMLY